MSDPLMTSMNVVRPAPWTLAAMQAKRLADLRVLVAEAQARSAALTAIITAQIEADPTASPPTLEQQLWDTLDVVKRLRVEQWILSQTAPT